MKADKENPYEFSRPLGLHELDDGPVERTIAADAAERVALASRFDLLELSCLNALLTATREPDSQLVRITGEFHADAVQRCIITLDPIAACIDEPVDTLYGPQEGSGEIADTQFEEATPPEPFEGDLIDLGELAAQQLALALDPYPRKSDAVAEEIYNLERSDDAEEEAGGPFSELAGWQKARR